MPPAAADAPTTRRRVRLRALFRRHWPWLRWPLLALTALFVVGVGLFAYLWFTVKLPADPPLVQSSIVYDAHGRQIAVFQQNGLHEPVPLTRISPNVVNALVSTEDRRFYEHHGVDPVGTVRALWHDVTGGSLQGGSTLTQQLVKNSYLTSDRSLWRKAKEAVLAIKLEQTHDKNDILDRYLNIVYFGRGAYGVESAAHVYFNTTAAQLSVDQAAFLVGVIRSPTALDPATNPDGARRRRDEVLDAMVSAGKLSQADAAQLKSQPVEAAPRDPQNGVTVAESPWFVELVREQAIAQFGESAVYGGGLRITTTLDLDAQHVAEQAIAKTLDQPDDPQAALVALDQSGAIRAYVGGRDYNALKVDLARGKDGGGSGRQAGSTFKPFVLAADIENGGTAGQRFDGPPTITLPTSSGPWTVSNFGNESFGNIDLIDATVHSVNTVYAQLVLQVGPDKAAALAHAAGIASDLPVEPSLTLGTGEVSPLELADAYLTFAREGQRVEPFAIQHVETSDGRVLFDAHPKTSTAMKADTAHVVDAALQQVVQRGTGTAANLDRPVAGKTGTTENNGDAWFAGYTPNYAAVVWMGYPDGSSHVMDNVHGITVTGGTLPAKIWHDFMSAALVNVPKATFPSPPAQLLQPPSTVASTPPSTVVASTEPSTTAPPASQPTTTAPPTTKPSTTTTTTSTTTTVPN